MLARCMSSTHLYYAKRVLRDAASRINDAILPTYCPLSGDKTETAATLSATGWAQIRFIDDPMCRGCGAPFEHEIGENAECGACLSNPLGLDEVRAAAVYDDATHKLIVGLKHGDRTDLTPLLGGWLKRTASHLLTSKTVVVPVPLHSRRLFHRRYNQSGLLAKFIAQAAGSVFAPQLIVRHRHTRPQQSLSADARQRNVSGAFVVPREKMKDIQGANILLVDDVLTTGATLKACGRALRGAGADQIRAVVLARVVKSGEDAI